MTNQSHTHNSDDTRNHHTNPNSPPTATFDPASITRPDNLLLSYYIILSCLTLILFPFVFLPLYFKYETLEYELDETGISMKWGILFRKEVNLTYRRIQDIHVTRDIIQRWLGLSTLSIQTASGSATPEMSIVGIKNPDIIRDYLYRKMRGVEDEQNTTEQTNSTTAANHSSEDNNDEALNILIEIRDAVRKLNKSANQNEVDPRDNHNQKESQSSESSS